MNMFKGKGKLVIATQCLLFVMGILYLLESIFIRGMFTNVFILLAVGVVGIIAGIVTLVKKEYKLFILDFVICFICLMIFYFLTK